MLMSNSITKQNFEKALVKMARSLSTDQWQAMVAIKGVRFPYTLSDKVKLLREMINRDIAKTAS